MAPDPDAALMVAFQRGDRSAFRALFEKHGRAMVRFCHRFVRDRSRAEELAQDVFLKLHRSAARYRPDARFKTYLYRIASNHCLNELRRAEPVDRRPSPVERGGEGGGGTELDGLPSSGASPEDMALGSDLEAAVAALLASLPEKQRTAFVLARFEGLSYEDIAEVLETSISAVKSLVHRATVSAAAALGPYAGGAEVSQ